MLLEGIFPAITTPFYPVGRINLRKLEHNVERYSRTGVSGLVVLGSTGEAILLSEDEQRQVLATAAGFTRADQVLIAGVGQESVLQTVAMAEQAYELHYDAILVRTPYYYRPQMRPQEMLGYFRAVADRSPLPVLLYSIPPYTGYELPVELVIELAAHSNILGLKDSGGKVERIAAILSSTSHISREVDVTPTFSAVTDRMVRNARAAASLIPNLISIGGGGLQSGSAQAAVLQSTATPAALKTRKKKIGFQVLCGSAAALLPSLEAGASGGILAFAACAPQACLEIFTAWKDRDPGLAAAKQERIRAASILIARDFGVPGIKAACDWNGYFGGVPRLPLLPLNFAERDAVAQALTEIRN